MESEGRGLERSRARGDSVDGSSSHEPRQHQVEATLGRRLGRRQQQHQHSHKQLMPGSGNTAAADACAGAGDAARHSWLGELSA